MSDVTVSLHMKIEARSYHQHIKLRLIFLLLFESMEKLFK